ncbi:hypothetical protein JOD45_000665 [Scopulibacillus daqui]|uniref:Tumor necrosis factor receptor superfamily member 19 n=1 Tax=Scopulibacillus daqui TaxID=1469162 RepID=A0ABS2PWQ1_9BACL|nr:hypothetical protein [Scopulibacillus daqui]MBM7644472.1 hypothetical protein [Scopulibacillus daqui]
MGKLVSIIIFIVIIGFIVFGLTLWEKVLKNNDKVLERKKSKKKGSYDSK